MPDLSYPVQLHEHLTNIPELVAHKLLRDMTDHVCCNGGYSIQDGEIVATEQLIAWHEDTDYDLELIRYSGLANYASGRIAPKILAVLYGLKAKGITDLPL